MQASGCVAEATRCTVRQVVVGVLGCPNLPLEPITDADGAAGAAERVGTAGVGALFHATRGGGAFVGPLKPGDSAAGLCVELLQHLCCSP